MLENNAEILYTVVVAVYNRPEEMQELLQSLVQQQVYCFKVIVVEDGSIRTCRELIETGSYPFAVYYVVQDNAGPGAARNTGVFSEYCSTPYVLFFDSDCVLPPDYFTKLCRWHTEHNEAELWGGPDASRSDFSAWQKAVSFAMTWRGSTGGIRGSQRSAKGFSPRTFNLGVSRERFLTIGGFAPVRYGEDVDLSLRLASAGVEPHLVHDLYVYHKRRESLRGFFRQVCHSGQARVWLSRRHGTWHVVHALPLLGIVLFFFFLLFGSNILRLVLCACVLTYTLLILYSSFKKYRSFRTSFLSLISVATMLTGYALGYLRGLFS